MHEKNGKNYMPEISVAFCAEGFSPQLVPNQLFVVNKNSIFKQFLIASRVSF
jgi:hypothetical protein